MANDELMLKELTKIRELLTPAPPPPPSPAPKSKFKGLLSEFKDFLLKYKVFGMAVAFIMGMYVGNVVQAIVDDLVMPIIEFALPPELGWEDLLLGPFRVGHLLGTLLTFAIVALVIFLLVKMLKKYNLN
jgi:large conductance mechanosensitive channel